MPAQSLFGPQPKVFSLHRSSEMVVLHTLLVFQSIPLPLGRKAVFRFIDQSERSFSLFQVIQSTPARNPDFQQQQPSPATGIGAAWQRHASRAQCVPAAGCGRPESHLGQLCCRPIRCGLPPSICVFMVLYCVSLSTTTIYACLKRFQAIK